MLRATKVAVATASSRGTMNDRSRPVSSIISTTAEIGPCVAAASTEAAPTIAYRPSGAPGHSHAQACPSNPPSSPPRSGRREQPARRGGA